MSSSTCIAPERPDPTVIAAQNDAFRKFVCLGKTPTEPIQGRLVITQSYVRWETGS